MIQSTETASHPTIEDARSSFLGPRLFIDLTTSIRLLGGAPIGITRTETKLARALLDANHLNPFPVAMAQDGTLRALDMSTAQDLLNLWQEQMYVPLRMRGKHATKVIELPGTTGPKRENKGPSLKSMRRQGLERKYYATRALLRQPRKIFVGEASWEELTNRFITQRSGSPETTHEPGVDLYGSVRHEIFCNAQLIVRPTARDFFWTAGLYSHCIRPRPLLELQRKTNMQIGCLLYDVIRVLYEEFNPGDINADVHLANTLDLMEAADMPLAISAWTRNTSTKLARAEERRHEPIQILPLGVDIPAQTLDLDADAILRTAITPRRFALAVGSIEPRKNIGHLLNVWQELARTGTPPLDLVLVGKEGHCSETEANRITSHPLFGKHIFWLDSCPDQALASLYAMSTVVLCASHAEGWGLPVSEALLQGRPVIASDTAAHPEASFGQALLLGVTDIAAWAEAVRCISTSPEDYSPDLSRLVAPTWDMAGKRLIAMIEDRITGPCMNERVHAYTTN